MADIDVLTCRSTMMALFNKVYVVCTYCMPSVEWRQRFVFVLKRSIENHAHEANPT